MQAAGQSCKALQPESVADTACSSLVLQRASPDACTEEQKRDAFLALAQEVCVRAFTSAVLVIVSLTVRHLHACPSYDIQLTQ
jgi:hypothetical protein